MITEEMLRAAAVRSSEIYVAHLEKGISRHEFSPEFEKRIQGIVEGRGKVMIDERLLSALEGIELTEREERYPEWLSRMDSETVEVFLGLFERVVEADRERILKKMFPLGMPDNGNYGINAKAVRVAIEGHKKSAPR
jgi:hypothetical protein